MDTNGNSPTPMQENLTPDLRSMIVTIYDYITELKQDYDRIINNVQLDRRTLEQLLGISESTIGRWRSRGVLPYYINSSGASYYIFEDVYVAVKSGKLQAKTFDPVAALKRLHAFKTGILFQSRQESNNEEEEQ